MRSLPLPGRRWDPPLIERIHERHRGRPVPECLLCAPRSPAVVGLAELAVLVFAIAAAFAGLYITSPVR